MDTQLTEAEVDAFVSNNGYLISFTEMDGDATNEIQDISLAGTDLSITSGSTIELENQGEGHLLISSEMIATGTYVYSLIVDNKLIDAKKFILSK